ncbi:ABC transporter ATP-binding protein C-terminal domain-containing protein, partial [Streptomyces sp. NPDC000851]
MGEGTSEVVQADERVIAAYLGEPFEGDPGE